MKIKDIIYREDAIKALEKLSACEEYGVEVGTDEETYIGKYEAITAISDLPSADRPQGEWIDMGDFEKCSVCKGTHLKEFQSYYGKVTWIKTPYCPQCGARMKGADDE